MYLIELKNHIQSFPKNHKFKFGLSEAFSWRGSYCEVAFEVLLEPMSREMLLDRINTAYIDTHYGYKGGEYRYSDNTPVNFESEYSSYSDGGYCRQLISDIEGTSVYKSDEDKLIKIAFV